MSAFDQADAIEGIRLKVHRAHEHLDALDRETAELTDLNPFHAGPPEINADATEQVFHLRTREPFPLLWSVILGEAVHNLRSALDHIVYQLTLDWHGSHLSNTGFPIVTDPGRWKKPIKPKPTNPFGLEQGCGMFLIRGIGPGPTAFIEALQPYPTRQPHDSVLLALHELWNQDKHRLLHFWGFKFVGQPRNVSIPGVVGSYAISLEPGVLKDGAKAFTVSFAEPNPHVKVDFAIAAAVTFENPADTGTVQPTESLASLWRATSDVIEPLIASIGHQHRPI